MIYLFYLENLGRYSRKSKSIWQHRIIINKARWLDISLPLVSPKLIRLLDWINKLMTHLSSRSLIILVSILMFIDLLIAVQSQTGVLLPAIPSSCGFIFYRCGCTSRRAYLLIIYFNTSFPFRWNHQLSVKFWTQQMNTDCSQCPVNSPRNSFQVQHHESWRKKVRLGLSHMNQQRRETLSRKELTSRSIGKSN